MLIYNLFHSESLPPRLGGFDYVVRNGKYYIPEDDSNSITDQLCSVVNKIRQAKIDNKMMYNCAGTIATTIVFTLHLFSDRRDWFWRARNHCYVLILIMKCIALISIFKRHHTSFPHRLLVAAVAITASINAWFSLAEVQFGEIGNNKFFLSFEIIY